MTEAQVQKKIIDFLEGRGFYVVKIVVANKAGTPDIIACTPSGRFVAIEVKTEKGKLSELQRHKLSQVVDAKGLAFVAYGWKGFITEFRNFLGEFE